MQLRWFCCYFGSIQFTTDFNDLSIGSRPSLRLALQHQGEAKDPFVPYTPAINLLNCLRSCFIDSLASRSVWSVYWGFLCAHSPVPGSLSHRHCLCPLLSHVQPYKALTMCTVKAYSICGGFISGPHPSLSRY